MEINRNNYELYMIDYLDAKLSAEQQGELMLFLAKNPDLQAEFDLLQNSVFDDEVHSIPFELKQELKKQEHIQVLQYDELLVAKLEGDLSKDELFKLNAEIHIYPELQHSYEQFQKTKLIADEAIVFSHKSSLRKQAQGLVLFTNFRMVSSIAAAFLVILSLWFFRSNKYGNDNTASLNNIINKNSNQEKPMDKVYKSSKQVETIKSLVKTISQKSKAISPIPKVPSIVTLNLVVTIIDKKEMNSLDVKLAPLNNNKIKTIQYVVIAKSNESNVVAQNNYLTPQQYLQKMINATAKNAVVDQNKPASVDDKNKSNIGFALLGLFNKATGSDVKLVRKYDNEGKITGYSVAANTLFANSR
ncbi:MAG: hypothetical protein NTU43_02810 [Bacteroidetes bacterium]|nr:hypothetical protein [Bacteroidota bacterium]